MVLDKSWTDGESWPNDFDEKVNRGKDLRGWLHDTDWQLNKLSRKQYEAVGIL